MEEINTIPHLEILRGSVLVNSHIVINKKHYLAIKSFNVYMLHDIFLSKRTGIVMETLNKDIYGKWLVETGHCLKLANSGNSLALKFPEYKTFPFNCTYATVSKAVLLITAMLNPEEVLRISTLNTYYYALNLDIVHNFKISKRLSMLENIIRLSKRLKKLTTDKEKTIK